MADEKPAAENKPATENKTAAAAANAVNQALAAGATDTSLTEDDKLWGMLAHISTILWFIGPLIVYLMKKDQSKFVAFHALQALVLTLALTVVYIVLLIPAIVLMAIIPFIFLLIGPLFSLIGLAVLVYVIYVAIKAKDGQTVKYVVIGDIIYKKVYGG